MENNIKKKFWTDVRIETMVAILLGIVALVDAWAGWIGSLHGGNQATNYAESNNMSAQANSEWSEASQLMADDMSTWNLIYGYMFDAELADIRGNKVEGDMIEEKIESIRDNLSDEFNDAIDWWEKSKDAVSPFDKEGFTESYYEDAQADLDKAQEILKKGQEDNSNGDKFGLCNVFFSLCLFLLGIVGIFKNLPNRVIVMGFAALLFVGAFIYMLTLPMPTGFDLLSYF